MWSTLVPVMVGGAIGLVGGWLGPWLIERRKEAAEKKETRGRKFEEFVAAVYEFDHWLGTKEAILAFGSEEKSGPSPFAKIVAISAVHFPEFEKEITGLEVVAQVYQHWMAQAGTKRTAGKIVEVNVGLLEVYNPYITRRDELMTKLKTYANEKFK